MIVPIQIGVIALLLGGYLLFPTLQGAEKKQPIARVETKVLVCLECGFSLGVPAGLTAKRYGKTVKLNSTDNRLVVTAGPAGTGSLMQGSKQFVDALKQGYTQVRVFGRQSQKVDGRDALATSGQAVNAQKVKIRFVSVLVSARPRDFLITTFTGFGTDPGIVLPQVNAIVNTFKVLPAK
ncbi:MAG: hypothetical protein ABIR57_09170 [Aeromicrobium sp.]